MKMIEISSDQFDDYQKDQNINTEDINIDAYLSDDEIPSYRAQPIISLMMKRKK